MSRSDRRRGGRNRSYREGNANEKNERCKNQDSRHSERSERKNQHETRGSGAYERRQERRHLLNSVSPKEIEESKIAIRAFKEHVVTCELCGEPISDIASAISNRGSENPVHFDCVLNKIIEQEKITPSEKVAYIGQGRFAVLSFENPHDQKHFSIKRTIEWEARDAERGAWRDEMAGLFSQVK